MNVYICNIVANIVKYILSKLIVAMKTLPIAIFSTFVHIACCLFPLTFFGFNFLSFLNFSDTTKHLFLGFQFVLSIYLIVRLSAYYATGKSKITKSESVLSWLSLGLVFFSFYINIYEPFHTEKQKMMKNRIERIKHHQAKK